MWPRIAVLGLSCWAGCGDSVGQASLGTGSDSGGSTQVDVSTTSLPNAPTDSGAASSGDSTSASGESTSGWSDTSADDTSTIGSRASTDEGSSSSPSGDASTTSSGPGWETTDSGSSSESAPGTGTETGIGTTSTSTGEASSDGSSSSDGAAAICGNDVLEDGEVCDDGNLEPGDGCEPDCTSSDDVEPEWTLEIGGVGTHFECGTGVAFDAEGNLIVAGYVEPYGIWIRKYDPGYTELWTVTYPVGTLDDCPNHVGVATDVLGNVAFIGRVAPLPSEWDIFVGMLDPEGGELWAEPVDGAAMGDDAGGNVAFDPQGNVLLTGAIVQTVFEDLWVAKYDPSGVQVWSDTFDGGVASDAGYGVVSDGAGNVFVAGVTWGPSIDGDIFVRKYDPDGAELWTDIYTGPDGNDFGYGIGVDATGRARVAGAYRSTVAHDVWLRSYAPDGGAVWTTTFDGTAGQSDSGRAVAVEGDGRAWVAGSANEVGLGQAGWLRQYDVDGGTVWTRSHPTPDVWLAVARADDGRIAVGGTYDSGGPSGPEAIWAIYPP